MVCHAFRNRRCSDAIKPVARLQHKVIQLSGPESGVIAQKQQYRLLHPPSQSTISLTDVLGRSQLQVAPAEHQLAVASRCPHWDGHELHLNVVLSRRHFGKILLAERVIVES